VLTLKDYLGIIRVSRAYGCFYGGMVVLSLGVAVVGFYIRHPHPYWFIAVEGLLTILFSVEIFLQILVQRSMYFRSSVFNVMEFALCVASLVAYIEVVVRTNVESYEWADLLIITLRYAARMGRVLFFLKYHARYKSSFSLSLGAHPKHGSDCSDQGDTICLEMEDATGAFPEGGPFGWPRDPDCPVVNISHLTDGTDAVD